MNDGTYSRAQVLYAFSESTEFVAAVYKPIDIFLSRIAETPSNDQNTLALYAGSLYDLSPADGYELTPNRDTINVAGSLENTVFGIVGATDRESTEVATFTPGDKITGNGLTTVELMYDASFNGYPTDHDAYQLAPSVTMSGVDHLKLMARQREAIRSRCSSTPLTPNRLLTSPVPCRQTCTASLVSR